MTATVNFLLSVVPILWINILLSGDNAVVIALACRDLKGRQKTLGMILGAGAAVVIRIIFTVIIATILAIPFVKLVGGLLLLWIAVKLILPEDEPDPDSVKSKGTLWGAVLTVVVADIVMSLDNVLAIAAAAHGDHTLIIVGLALSVPLVVAGSSLIMLLITKLPILVWIGAALLGWIAGDMLFSDPALAALSPTDLIHEMLSGVCAVLVVAAGWLIGRRRAGEAAD